MQDGTAQMKTGGYPSSIRLLCPRNSVRSERRLPPRREADKAGHGERQDAYLAAEAAEAEAAFLACFLACFLCVDFFAVEAAAGAAASEAGVCAKAAVANRPTITAAISFFMTSSISRNLRNFGKTGRLLRPVIANNARRRHRLTSNSNFFCGRSACSGSAARTMPRGIEGK